MPPSELQGILQFLRDAEPLKQTLRNAWTSNGRVESAAEHTWRVCLFAMLFEDQYPQVDFKKLLKICLIHDLGEAIGGDIPAIQQTEDHSKAIQERADLIQLVDPLPARLRKEITALWDEYEQAVTPEAKLAKAFDKLETILQHNQGKNPDDFNHLFNLEYGQRYMQVDELIRSIRNELDLETQTIADARSHFISSQE
jgi:putative hydrolases of HD superfamily